MRNVWHFGHISPLVSILEHFAQKTTPHRLHRFVFTFIFLLRRKNAAMTARPIAKSGPPARPALLPAYFQMPEEGSVSSTTTRFAPAPEIEVNLDTASLSSLAAARKYSSPFAKSNFPR